MKVRTVMDQEHAPGVRQVILRSIEGKPGPGDQTVWIPEENMEGIVAGAIVEVTVTPKPAAK